MKFLRRNAEAQRTQRGAEIGFSDVAQTVSLLCRRLAVGAVPKINCRIKPGVASAGCQPAIQQTNSLRYDLTGRCQLAVSACEKVFSLCAPLRSLRLCVSSCSP